MSVKSEMLSYIRNKHYGGDEFIAGGTIERYMAQVSPTKSSNASRQLRQLAQDGILEKRIRESIIEGRTVRFVEYRLKG